MKMIVAAGLCAGLLGMAAPAKAQFVSAYLLTKRGDTIRGYLRPPTARTMAQSLAFRQQPASPDTETKYQLKQLQSVGLLNGKTYVVQKMQPLMGRHAPGVVSAPDDCRPDPLVPARLRRPQLRPVGIGWQQLRKYLLFPPTGHQRAGSAARNFVSRPVQRSILKLPGANSKRAFRRGQPDSAGQQLQCVPRLSGRSCAALGT